MNILKFLSLDSSVASIRFAYKFNLRCERRESKKYVRHCLSSDVYWHVRFRKTLTMSGGALWLFSCHCTICSYFFKFRLFRSSICSWRRKFTYSVSRLGSCPLFELYLRCFYGLSYSYLSKRNFRLLCYRLCYCFTIK